MATVNGEPIMSDRFQEERCAAGGRRAGRLVSQMAIEQAAAAAA